VRNREDVREVVDIDVNNGIVRERSDVKI
jgi:hypothetical protein